MGWARSFTRDGGSIWAFIALTAVGITAGYLLVSASLDDARSAQATQNAANRYERSARVEAEARCSYLSGPEKALCGERIVRRAYDARRQYAELQSQQTSAIWNRVMGAAAMMGLLFSMAGVLMIFSSFEEQRRANRLARAQTINANRHAREALEHAQRATATEFRPYVFVDKIAAELLYERHYRVVVWLKNFGKTPARNINSIVTTYVTRELSKLRPLKPRADHIALGTAAPDACRRAFTRLSFGKRQWSARPYDRWWGVVRISYTYTDDAEETTFTESIDYYINPIELMDPEPTFFLLTDARIEWDRKWRAKQGDLLANLRARPGLIRIDEPDEDAENEGK